MRMINEVSFVKKSIDYFLGGFFEIYEKTGNICC